MATIGIAAYTVRVRRKRHDEYLFLGDVGAPSGFHTVLREFLDSLKREHAHDEASQLLQHIIRLDSNGDTSWGLLESGEYGWAAEGIDINTMETSYTRDPDDAEMIPFYFSLYAPNQNDTAVMLLQRHGPRGIYHAFSKALREFCEKRLPDLQLDISRLVPAEVLSELLKGGVRAIQVISFRPPRDIFDKLRFLGNMRDPGTMTIEIKAKKKGFLFGGDWVKRVTQGKTRIVELPDSLGPGKVRFRVDYRGKSRMVDLQSLETLAPYVDATADLKYEDTGHPNFDSIHEYCSTLLSDLLQQMGKA